LASLRSTVFSSIIGRVIVVNPIDTVLAPVSLGPELRNRTCPSSLSSTKTCRLSEKSRIA
jgi:hypothetical protein